MKPLGIVLTIIGGFTFIASVVFEKYAKAFMIAAPIIIVVDVVFIILGNIFYGRKSSYSDDSYSHYESNSNNDNSRQEEETHYYARINGRDEELREYGSGASHHFEDSLGNKYKDDGHGNLHQVDSPYDD